MSLIAIAMNVLLAGLLLTALGFGWRLDRRLRSVRDGQAAFAKAVAELDIAAARAQAGLAELRAATDEAIDLLGGRIVRAREAGDRLDASLVRAELAPIQAARASAPAAERLPAAAAPRSAGLEALLARMEQAPHHAAAPRPEPRRPIARPVFADDDLFTDGGRV
jgi:hypothetical protein